MLLKHKKSHYQQYLLQLPKIKQDPADFQILESPAAFTQTLLKTIAAAQHRIYLTALYLEQDEGGERVLRAVCEAKRTRPELDIAILVDWHRAQRGRIGDEVQQTNADWYTRFTADYPDIDLPIYGVPVNTREALGVLHLKGFIIDDTVIYSGASINNVYLNQQGKYRYDRYHVLLNPVLANTMLTALQTLLNHKEAVHRLNQPQRPKTQDFRHAIRRFRQVLRHLRYRFDTNADNTTLAVTPLIGLGKANPLNNTIQHLMLSTHKRLILCTPYFNLPPSLIKNIVYLLRKGRQIEIIVGDKTANDFYIPQDQPFRIIGALPYLYEINLRRFMRRLQRFINNHQLTIRIWKDGDNSFHLKGVWVDDSWMLITGNNLNPRAWRLDLENGILIHDPQQQLSVPAHAELERLRVHTTAIPHYRDLDNLADYPLKIRKLIRRLRRTRVDRLIKRIL